MKHRGILKRLGTVLLGLTLALSLLPTAALAADEWEQVITLTDSQDSNGLGWTWTAETKILALNNCNLTFSGDGFILPDGATVQVSGSNTIRYNQNNQTGSGSTGIEAGSDTGASGLTIQGDSMDDKLTLIYSVRMLTSRSPAPLSPPLRILVTPITFPPRTSFILMTEISQ